MLYIIRSWAAPSSCLHDNPHGGIGKKVSLESFYGEGTIDPIKSKGNWNIMFIFLFYGNGCSCLPYSISYTNSRKYESCVTKLEGGMIPWAGPQRIQKGIDFPVQ